jgi:hypothetical protein
MADSDRRPLIGGIGHGYLLHVRIEATANLGERSIRQAATLGIGLPEAYPMGWSDEVVAGFDEDRRSGRGFGGHTATTMPPRSSLSAGLIGQA